MPGDTRKKKSSSPDAGLTAWQFELLRLLEGARKIALLGIGQPLKGDDGAGEVVARSVSRRLGKNRVEGIAVIAAADTPESRTSQIRRFEPSHVLIVDAGTGGYAPGTVFIADPRKIAGGEMSTHRLPLSLLAKFLEETLPCAVILLAIEPSTFSPDRKLSPAVKISANEVARFLADRMPEVVGGGS